jgi:hypothetical protein
LDVLPGGAPRVAGRQQIDIERLALPSGTGAQTLVDEIRERSDVPPGSVHAPIPAGEDNPEVAESQS